MSKRKSGKGVPTPPPAGRGAAARKKAMLADWVAAEVAASPWAPRGTTGEDRAARAAESAAMYRRFARRHGSDALVAAQMIVAHNLAMDLLARADAAGEDSPWHAHYARDGGRMMTMSARHAELLLGRAPEKDDDPDA
jgi:hypothetical protein